MKFVILGHSYVKQLSNLNITKFEIEKNTIHVNYFGFGGATFHSLLNSFDFDKLVTINPDFCLIILGGNDFKDQNNFSKVKENASKFYKLIREKLPLCKIIASQVELRDYKPNNKFSSPTFDDFSVQRKYFNKFLLKLKHKDHIFRVDGKGRLDRFDELYKSDKVHLNYKGVCLLFNLIKNCIKFILNSTSD